MKTNYKHSRRKLMPSKPVESVTGGNVDQSRITSWSSKNKDRLSKMFTKSYLLKWEGR